MSMAIFIIVTTLFVSGTIVLIDLNRKAEQTRSTLDILDFVVTSMTKKARYGYGYTHTSTSCVNASDLGLNSSMGFGVTVDEMSDGDIPFLTPHTYTYWLNGEKRLMRSFGGRDYTLTPEDVKVERLCFYLSGELVGNGDGHPLLTVFISGYAGQNTESGTPFNIQTSVSQRGTNF